MGLTSEKKWKFCKQNVMEEQKEPPVVSLQQMIFYNVFILRFIRSSDQGV